MIRFLIITIILAFSFTANAQERVPFSKNQLSLLNEAQDYLTKVQTFRANFIQVNPDTDLVSSGEIFISKPGRLKMSYDAPFKIDYFVNGDNLVQYDYDLDEVTRGEAPENPLKILLYDGVTLKKNDIMDVTNITDDGSSFNVFLLNRTSDLREVSGLILKFRKLPIELISIQRVDNEGNKTETNLTSVKLNTQINDSEFEFRKSKPSFPNSSKR